MAKSEAITKEIIALYGVVQGVGFRPFVARLAREHHLTGAVYNAEGGVISEVYGTLWDIERFVCEVQARKPVGSHISDLKRCVAALGADEAIPEVFTIRPSSGGSMGLAMPCPDLATCDDCLRELFAPGARRYLNPFISCTNCGPRFSIIDTIPYDRANTTMAAFELCEHCAMEYGAADDRRYHAQTLCCNECGPRLNYVGRHFGKQGRPGQCGPCEGPAALSAATEALLGGAVVALKGIGGYHLSCSPYDEAAVARLRRIKDREYKPFAVMFADIASVQEHCEVSAKEAELLLSSARPIVLLRRKETSIVPAVYGSSWDLGAFLPYTPLQHLLLAQTGPLVMTSANISALPLIKDDAEMLQFYEDHSELGGVLGHDRAIRRRLDDAVTAIALQQPLLLRRARGYAPLPLQLSLDGPPLLALGGQEKSAFCLCRDSYAYLSAEIGDLESLQAERVFEETLDEMRRLLGIAPEFVVCDMHPEYTTTRLAGQLGLPLLYVQHHHAHIASVMAEHGLTEPVLGIACDGAGYGGDGTLWGGEFLLVTPQSMQRLGHLKAVTLLGSDLSVRQAWKTALCMLYDAGIGKDTNSGRDSRAKLVYAALAKEVNTVRSSSMGRLFDAVSALLGICQEATYGGQCAVELENAAVGSMRAVAGSAAKALPYALREEQGQLIVDFAPCIRAIWELSAKGYEQSILARRFHSTVSEMLVTVCQELARSTGVRRVALGGGVFANRLLLEQTIPALQKAGFVVYRNLQFPAGDGGLALGQAYIGLAAARKGHIGKE